MDWQLGQYVIVVKDVKDDKAKQLFPNSGPSNHTCATQIYVASYFRWYMYLDARDVNYDSANRKKRHIVRGSLFH